MSYTVALLDRLPNAIAVVTDIGTIEYRNKAFEHIFGTDTNWLSQGVRAVAGERGWLQGFFLAGGEDQTDVEAAGRVYRVDKVMNIEGAERPSVALLFEDVTAQREAEQAKSDFTSMIVHDLRGPLSGIQGTMEFVLSQDSSKIDSMYVDLLNEAQRESERMMNLINELLDFSKIESGNFVVDQEPVRLEGLLKRSVRSLQSVAARDEIVLLSAHPRDLPQIHGSVEKLTQAVINLISNSLKFTPKKGLISVGAQVVRTADQQPESVVITITDSGMGIKSGEIQQIWEKYKQTKNKSLRGGGGTGLGLYIVRQIVKAHGGDVTVASVEGVGTSMVVSLPLKRAAA